jgi:hypothetical protein
MNHSNKNHGGGEDVFGVLRGELLVNPSGSLMEENKEE